MLRLRGYVITFRFIERNNVTSPGVVKSDSDTETLGLSLSFAAAEFVTGLTLPVGVAVIGRIGATEAFPLFDETVKLKVL